MIHFEKYSYSHGFNVFYVLILFMVRYFEFIINSGKAYVSPASRENIYYPSIDTIIYNILLIVILGCIISILTFRIAKSLRKKSETMVTASAFKREIVKILTIINLVFLLTRFGI